MSQLFVQQISTSTNDKWYGFTCSRLESTGFGAYHTSSSPDFSAGAAAGTSLFASATSGLPSGAPPQANSSAACSRVGSFLAPPATSATAPAASGLGGLFTDTISVESTTHVRWIGASAPAAASAFDSVAPTSTERLTAFNSASTGATGGGAYGVTSRYSTVDVFRTSRFAASSGPSRWFPPDAGIFSTSIASSTEETWGITPSATSTPAAQLYGTSRGRGTGKPAWRGSSMEPTRYGMQPTDMLVSISAMTVSRGLCSCIGRGTPPIVYYILILRKNAKFPPFHDNSGLLFCLNNKHIYFRRARLETSSRGLVCLTIALRGFVQKGLAPGTTRYYSSVHFTTLPRYA